MTGVTILERMTAARADLERRWRGRRIPKAFYLSAEDWAEFKPVATERVTGPFGNNPVVQRTDPAIGGVPVRLSKAAESRLYDLTGAGRAIPRDPNAPRPLRPEIECAVPADKVFAALDALSRTRALTEAESVALEAAMKGRVVLSQREAARLGVRT